MAFYGLGATLAWPDWLRDWILCCCMKSKERSVHSLYSPLPPSPLPLTNEKLGEMDPTVLAGLYYGLQHAAHMQPSPCSTVARSFPPLKADGESATLLDFTLRKTVENCLFLKIPLFWYAFYLIFTTTRWCQTLIKTNKNEFSNYLFIF